MVKVLLFQLFESQRVVAIDEEPLEIVSTGNAFLAATKNGSIHHYSAGVECILLHQFHTVNPSILALQYAPSTDCVITLEKDSELSAINVARIYYNWRSSLAENSGDESDTPPISPSTQTPPILGSSSSHPSSGSNSAHNNIGLGVFKIPIPSSIVCITVCPASGRVAAATKSGVSLWALASPHNSEGVFAMEKVLELDTPNVTRLALYTPYLAYSTDREAKILCLNISYQDPSAEHFVEPKPTPVADAECEVNTGPSGFTQDEHFVELEFDVHGMPTHKFQLASITSSPPASPVPQRNSSSSQNGFERLGPLTDSDHRASVNSEGGYTLNSSVLLVHRRFSNDDALHSLAFLPEFPQLFDEDETARLLRPPSENSDNTPPPFTGMRCLVSTTRQGYIYTLTKPALLVTYSYTAETLQCCASSCFLYALTPSGLETWTLRTSSEASSEFGENFPPPCLIGMQPFISLQRIVVVGDSVLLLSKYPCVPLQKNTFWVPFSGESKPAYLMDRLFLLLNPLS